MLFIPSRERRRWTDLHRSIHICSWEMGAQEEGIPQREHVLVRIINVLAEIKTDSVRGWCADCQFMIQIDVDIIMVSLSWARYIRIYRDDWELMRVYHHKGLYIHSYQLMKRKEKSIQMLFCVVMTCYYFSIIALKNFRLAFSWFPEVDVEWREWRSIQHIYQHNSW